MTERPSPIPNIAQEPPPNAGEDARLKGILLLVGGALVLPLTDSVAKILGETYPVIEVTWARYFFHFALMAPVILWRYGIAGFLPPRPLLQILRSAILLVSTLCYFWAITILPLADALALAFIFPLVVTALAPLLLSEQVGLRRWSAVVVGFLGALIVIRPGFAGVDFLGAVGAIGSGFTYGFYLIVTRKLAGSAPALVTLAFTALVGSIGMTAMVPFVWQTPTLADLGLMVLLGALAVLANYLIIRAFDYAPASLLAPFGYTEMVGAVTVGFVVFGDFPDGVTWIGIAVIIGSGIYISFRERRRGPPERKRRS
jgi:drug/metabolite transporter (DMT)-like permease